jgi:aspartate kinase
VCIDAIRTLHKATMDHFGFPEHTVEEVTELLDECEDMLNGVRLIQELSPKSLDQLVSYGERCSVRIVAARLNQIGVPAQSFDAWDVGVLTTSDFGDAKLLPDSERAIRAAFSKIDPDVVAVVTGFIGHDANRRVTTLGRGGSDLTATALGAALGVDEIQVWKDVDGILTGDPRVIKTAIPVTEVTYEEVRGVCVCAGATARVAACLSLAAQSHPMSRSGVDWILLLKRRRASWRTLGRRCFTPSPCSPR